MIDNMSLDQEPTVGYGLMNNFLINNISPENSHEEPDQLRRLQLQLEYFFMDPIKKWKKRNTRPWKLLVQILKLIVFTYQLIIFGSNMAKFITYKDEMQTTFKLLFLKDWTPSADALPYPGPYVPYAVQTKPDFYKNINHAIKTYANISDLVVGPFGYRSDSPNIVSQIDVCVTQYVRAEFEPNRFVYNYSMFTETKCKPIKGYAPASDQKWHQFDIRNVLKDEDKINFSTMISTTLKLPLRTLLIEDASSGDDGIVCFEVDLEILYDNRHRDGLINIELVSLPRRAFCEGSLTEETSYFASRQVTNILVLLIAALSCILCIRSLWKAWKLLKYTQLVLSSRGRYLTFYDKLEFCDNWLVLIVINDIMIACATVIISSYDERLLETNNYTTCSLLIGVGNFLTWAGLLRYLSFFKKYNLLLVTLRKSFAHVLRFMLCTMLIYCGFCFCGWIVFGPYHFKFRQLSTTTECLFALINGDDMFDTFVLLRSDIGSVWWFSRIYLYLFVSLFIYVVLSLFIALIMDAYEIIKQYSENGFPKTKLQAFYLDGDLSKLGMSPP